MINKVVYVLGAGFSAPLGLPVMSNFIIKSKDLYFHAPEQYGHFKNVFDLIDKLSPSKSYFNTDLFNIEEILSILEMGTFLEGRRIGGEGIFTDYIIDVVKAFTPPMPQLPNELPLNWDEFLFRDTLLEAYGCFVGNLFALQIIPAVVRPHAITALKLQRFTDIKTEYAIITLNYDQVLENCAERFNELAKQDTVFNFIKTSEPTDWKQPPLYKLHGSVDTRLIVPPTWAKGTEPKIKDTWKHTFEILKQANYLRFIGYSLSTADSYFKYLLKGAIIGAPHLKGIDVICLDEDGSVKKRYDDFIRFRFYRFRNANIKDYLQLLREAQNMRNRNIQSPLIMNKLEAVHEDFM
jgi:hypothetical protein